MKYSVDQILNVSYESFVTEFMLKPLEMNNTCVGLDFENKENIALPYDYDDGQDDFVLVMEEFKNNLHIYNVKNNPELFTSAKDICNWMIMRLNNGNYKGRQIVSSDFISQSHSLQVANGGSDYSKGNINLGTSFDLFIDYFHGHHLVSSYGHRGNFDSRLMLFPQDKLGVIVLTGSTFSGRWILGEVIAENLILGEYQDWNDLGLNIPRWVNEMKKKPEELARLNEPNNDDSHNLKLSAYLGTYYNKAYGQIIIIEQNNKLKGIRSVTSFDLDLVSNDKFKLYGGNNYLRFKTMQFHLDSMGKAEKLTVDYESSLPPIEFVRIKE